MFRNLFKLIIVPLPWVIKRFILVSFYRYTIHPTSRIGLAWVFPKKLIMEEGSRIGHLTICREGVSLVHLGKHATIGRGNWITGEDLKSDSYKSQPERLPQLVIGEHTAITHRHYIDCTASVIMGSYTTFAGFHSQVITHGINYIKNCQEAKPISIGSYCIIGTGSIILGGSELPDRSVLGAGSVLNKKMTEPQTVYGGVPAKPIKMIDSDAAYFKRLIGYVQ